MFDGNVTVVVHLTCDETLPVNKVTCPQTFTVLGSTMTLSMIAKNACNPFSAGARSSDLLYNGMRPYEFPDTALLCKDDVIAIGYDTTMLNPAYSGVKVTRRKQDI